MISNFRKKQKSGASGSLLFKAGVVLMLCICGMLIFTNMRMFQKRAQLNRQVNDLKNKIADLKASNGDLEQGISKSDDINYIEKVAREELDLQKPGEKVFSFIKDPNEQAGVIPQKSIWPAWLGWIGGWFKK